MTYALHHSTPYLERAFFSLVGAVDAGAPGDVRRARTAERQARSPRACCSTTTQAIYGRYWGALEYIPCLHFEASYYSPMEWAIAQRLARFEGGAQGEHKMARGFLPVQTNSFHWLAHPAFNDAIARYLERESGRHRRIPGRTARAQPAAGRQSCRRAQNIGLGVVSS